MISREYLYLYIYVYMCLCVRGTSMNGELGRIIKTWHTVWALTQNPRPVHMLNNGGDFMLNTITIFFFVEIAVSASHTKKTLLVCFLLKFCNFIYMNWIEISMETYQTVWSLSAITSLFINKTSLRGNPRIMRWIIYNAQLPILNHTRSPAARNYQH